LSNNKIRLIPLGYLACRKILERLEIFKDLVRHNSPYGGYIGKEFARPLEELITENIPPGRMYDILEQHINQLIPLVHRDLFYARISLGATRGEAGSEAERHYDMILQFFEFIRDGGGNVYNMVIGALDQGIGYYKAKKHQAFWDIFNPVSWIAFILRIPLIIIQKTGLVIDEKGASWILKIYGLIIRALILLILAFLATKLGVSIPWNVLFK